MFRLALLDDYQDVALRMADWNRLAGRVQVDAIHEHIPNVDDLAKRLNMDVPVIHTHLTNLRLLGLVKLINEADVGQLAELQVQEKISRKTNDFLRASRVVNELKKISMNYLITGTR